MEEVRSLADQGQEGAAQRVTLDGAYINSLCELCSEDNELLAFGRLRKMDELFEFEVTSGARLKDVHFDDRVKINVMNLRKGLRVLAGNLRLANKQMFRVLVTDILADLEQRGFVRVHTDQEMQVYGIPDERTMRELVLGRFKPWEKPAPTPRAMKKPRPDRLHDISISGCRFSSDREWRQGDRVFVRVQLAGTWIEQPAEVLRVQVQDGRYMHGCQFIDSAASARSDDLAKVVFALQNEKRRRLN